MARVSESWKLDRIGSARAGTNPTVLARLPQSYAVIGDSQYLPGYCVLLVDDPRIDRWYEKARQAGALGGKLLGAGNGGFLLLYCEPHLQDRVREQLHDMTELPFRFEAQGSSIVHVGEGALG